MKYQANIRLGNFDSRDEARAAVDKLQKSMTDKERDKIIESRVIDSNSPSMLRGPEE